MSQIYYGFFKKGDEHIKSKKSLGILGVFLVVVLGISAYWIMFSSVTIPNSSNHTNSSYVEQSSSSSQGKIFDATVTVSFTSDSSIRGTILEDMEVEYKKDDTVLDVTTRILKQKEIQFEVSGTGSTAYLKGIDNLYEFDEGPLSGWNILVNGAMIDRSAGAYSINPGDSVNWNYTKNYLGD